MPVVCLAFLAAKSPHVAAAEQGGSGNQPPRSTVAEQTSLGITIYNDNLGLVKDVRRLSLPTGVQNLWFEGVAALIDPTSVHIRSLDAPEDLEVLEQNFEYDLISPEKLMEKYLGKTVELIYRAEGKEDEVFRAKLLGTEGGYVYEIDGKIAVDPPGSVVLPSLPEGLISKPSLVWLLDNGRAQHTVEASYLTEGIGWKANYVAVLSKDDTKVDLSGWVTVDNKSGATYKNASLKLVAGDVNRVQPEVPPRRVPVALDMAQVRGGEPFREEAFFEYHLYTLQRKTTVNNTQIKQIGLLDAEDIGVKKSFIYSPVTSYFSRISGPDKSKKVGVYLSLDNSKKNNMGMPLPKGVVRVYKKDMDGALQFIGEDRIDHTPEDETIRIKMGDAFDIVAERVQTDFKVLDSGHLYESSYEITIRNHKDEDIVVSVVERLSGDWTILGNTHPYDKESSHRIRFDVPVERKASGTLQYTARIRY
jgi:hypothetical protein